MQLIIGTPKTVLPSMKRLLQVLAQEVVPAIREYAREIALPDPYERTPGMVEVHVETTRAPVVDREAFATPGAGRLGTAQEEVLMLQCLR